MLIDSKHWASIVSSVRTELGLLALVLLVVGAFFAVVSGRSGVQLTLLVEEFGIIIGLVIIIAGSLLIYRAHKSSAVDLEQNRHFARCLGEEIFKAYRGVVFNALPKEQAGAYQDLHDYMTSSRLFASAGEKAFIRELTETVIYNAMKDPASKNAPEIVEVCIEILGVNQDRDRFGRK